MGALLIVRLRLCRVFHRKLNPVFPQPVAFIWLNSESILLALKQDPEVAHLAAVYLKYSVIGLPAYAFNTVSRCVTRPSIPSRLEY